VGVLCCPDVLEEVLRQKTGPLSPSTHVISNRMVFNDEGFLTGFSEPLIHMFNKHERHDSSAPYYDAICSRRNVILLGDGLGDVHMADGTRGVCVCIRTTLAALMCSWCLCGCRY